LVVVSVLPDLFLLRRSQLKNLFIKLAVISGLVFSTITLAAEDLKVMYIGTPQVGPPIILTQAYAQNLTIPNTFISMKDCASALRAVEQNENVAFFISDMTTMAHKHAGEDCVPKFKPEDIVGTMATSWHLCRKPNGKNLNTGRIAIGVSSVLPGPGIIRDFNKQNGLNTVNVSLPSSSQTVGAILNGDIDWGLLQTGIAEPMIADGKLDCPLTFIPSGTTGVSKDKYIANHYDMKVPDLHCTFLLVVKSKDPKVREAALQAAQNKNFAAFLDKGKWINVNTSGKFTQKDVDNFNAYIKKMSEYNY